MLRTLFSVLIASALLLPATVDVASAKGSGKAAAKAAREAAKAKAKAAAKSKAKAKGKKFNEEQAKLKEEADAAREELKKEDEKAEWNEARIARISELAGKKNDEALSKVVESLKGLEKERHEAVKAHYEAIAAKAPPEEEAAEEKKEE